MTYENYLYCCTVHLVNSLNITLPTNALISAFVGSVIFSGRTKILLTLGLMTIIQRQEKKYAYGIW
jgi:hypothetical protein